MFLAAHLGEVTDGWRSTTRLEQRVTFSQIAKNIASRESAFLSNLNSFMPRSKGLLRWLDRGCGENVSFKVGIRRCFANSRCMYHFNFRRHQGYSESTQGRMLLCMASKY